MHSRLSKIGLLLLLSSASLRADDLPLPLPSAQGLPTLRPSAAELIDRPTSVIKLPSTVVTVPVAPVSAEAAVVPPLPGVSFDPNMPDTTMAASGSTSMAAAPSDQKLADMERSIVESQLRFNIARAHREGRSGTLKQVIVVNGPVDPSLSMSPTPPPSGPGEKVAFVGLNETGDAKVEKSLEQFFGVPMTPVQERQLLKTVETQLAADKSHAGMKVRLAGWWPDAGIMAVSLVPQGG